MERKIAVSGEQPGFVLAYLNASQNCVHLLAVPAGLQVPFADEAAALAHCYAAAGPARCREALMECWPCRRIPDIWRCRPPCWSALRPVRAGAGGLFRGADRRRSWPLWPQPGAGHFAGRSPRLSVRLDADAVVPQAHRRGPGAVWDAFFRQDLDLLPATLPEALRASSAALLTDLTALD